MEEPNPFALQFLFRVSLLFAQTYCYSLPAHRSLTLSIHVAIFLLRLAQFVLSRRIWERKKTNNNQISVHFFLTRFLWWGRTYAKQQLFSRFLFYANISTGKIVTAPNQLNNKCSRSLPTFSLISLQLNRSHTNTNANTHTVHIFLTENLHADRASDDTEHTR